MSSPVCYDDHVLYYKLNMNENKQPEITKIITDTMNFR